jgi:hypothetical protein
LRLAGTLRREGDSGPAVTGGGEEKPADGRSGKGKIVEDENAGKGSWLVHRSVMEAGTALEMMDSGQPFLIAEFLRDEYRDVYKNKSKAGFWHETWNYLMTVHIADDSPTGIIEDIDMLPGMERVDGIRLSEWKSEVIKALDDRSTIAMWSIRLAEIFPEDPALLAKFMVNLRKKYPENKSSEVAFWKRVANKIGRKK